MYQWDEPKPPDRPGIPPSITSFSTHWRRSNSSLWLDPAAIGPWKAGCDRSDSPRERPKRWPKPCEDWGDLAPSMRSAARCWDSSRTSKRTSERLGSCSRIESCRSDGSVSKTGISTNLPSSARETVDATSPPRRSKRSSGGTHLQTHALVGLVDLTDRYPIGPAGGGGGYVAAAAAYSNVGPTTERSFAWSRSMVKAMPWLGRWAKPQ